ncbi:MAG: hypothetical protein CVV37_05865 [Nitrospira bacterium HGW-Nitrospira-1]|nr:MAG: hypothetical protein CVV37_05865 [Nitrospira bacterium HGW-Nitrospira-1]
MMNNKESIQHAADSMNGKKSCLLSTEKGFSLVELMITIVTFLFIVAAASSVFTSLFTQFKQQSKIGETNIEGVIGLDMLRWDIEHAGYGLPHGGLIAYTEVNGDPFSLNDAPTDIPRAIISRSNAVYAAPNNIFNESDYLAIKSSAVALNNTTAGKWNYLTTVAGNPLLNVWTPAAENVPEGGRGIVISSGNRTLITNAGSFSARCCTNAVANIASFAPGPNETYLLYGVNHNTDLRRPFNRVDYYIDRPAANMPQRCAPNTGVLERAVVNQGNDSLNPQPVLDCVADMQVVYALDNDENGEFIDGVGGDVYTDTLALLSAEDIRRRVKEVRVFVLAHEGQRDATYEHPTPIVVGPDAALGRAFALAGTDRNYRWKVYTIVVKPYNLR